MAARVPAEIDFNPILLKPSSDKRAQVIIHGQAMAELSARDYHTYKPRAMQAVLESWGRLCARFDAIIVEGAGSPAEINLRARDIANMGFAETVDCPVILIADIDRGGVFASWSAPWNCSRPVSRRGSRALSSTVFAVTSACWSPACAGWRRAPASLCSGCCPICMACIWMRKMRCPG